MKNECAGYELHVCLVSYPAQTVFVLNFNFTMIFKIHQKQSLVGPRHVLGVLRGLCIPVDWSCFLLHTPLEL